MPWLGVAELIKEKATLAAVEGVILLLQGQPVGVSRTLMVGLTMVMASVVAFEN